MERKTAWRQRFQHFHERHGRLLDGLFFAGGFASDVLTAGVGVDNLFIILQQLLYLAATGLILFCGIIREARPGSPPFPPWLERCWRYHSFAAHFCLGSLMNLYSIFFLMSASLFSSAVFVLLLFAALAANEMKAVRDRGVDLKAALFFICAFCFASLLFPLAIGRVGLLPFLCAFAATLLLVAFFYSRLRRRGLSAADLGKRLLLPGLGVSGAFLLLYLLGLIPPVPLSAKKLGIYHEVERRQSAEAFYYPRPSWDFLRPDWFYFAGTAIPPEGSEGLRSVPVGDKYLLYHERPWWRFWHSGDQDFVARPGDKIALFAAIASPARIADTVYAHWYFRDPRSGWTSADRIPMRIAGGRKEGFRGFTTKANYSEGEWRASVETEDGREIGRIYFTVRKEDAAGETTTEGRRFHAETY